MPILHGLAARRRAPIISVTAFCIGLLYTLPISASPPLNNEPLSPLPTLDSLKLDVGKIKLGEKLFKDTRLSKDNSTACITCHDLGKGGVDGLTRSIGVRQQTGDINTPSVFNSGLNFKQFWDGRSATLEEQIDQVVHNPKELDMSWTQITEVLAADPEIVQLFQASYADGLQSKNIQDAISTFERSLLTPAPFDRYLQGNVNAISTSAQKGYQLFKEFGCVACHQGVNIGGNMFQKFGAMDDYFGKRGHITDADLGRYNVTKNEEDKHVFKVPSLRNVALTAPYFHDGSAQQLIDAVDVMFRHQLGRTGSDEEKQLIVEFLRTLSGERTEVEP